MRFDINDFAVFDIHILAAQGRGGRLQPRPCATRRRAASRASSDEQRKTLARNVTMGLPGSTESLTHRGGAGASRRVWPASRPTSSAQHFVDFLSEVVPVAEKLGLRLCCHPDDPPFPLLGLPRVMSTEADYVYMTRCSRLARPME